MNPSPLLLTRRAVISPSSTLSLKATSHWPSPTCRSFHTSSSAVSRPHFKSNHFPTSSPVYSSSSITSLKQQIRCSSATIPHSPSREKKMAPGDQTRIKGAWEANTPVFTEAVQQAMRELYPEEIADRSWDNVGLLLDNSQAAHRSHKVMVTNDLTYQVAQEAIQANVSVIVSYHPFIFSGLKSITSKDPQQATLLELVKAGIAVYCPHTAVDAAPSGLNSWLADIVAGAPNDKFSPRRVVAVPCSTAPESHKEAGYGIIEKRGSNYLKLTDIIKRLAEQLGGLRHIMIASPPGTGVAAVQVGSFAVCAGSGYDVLKNADVDLIVTGEMNHHSALRAIQQGRTVLTVFHSNSERAYLREILRPRLEEVLRRTVPGAEVMYSEMDQDPFTILDVKDLV